MNSNQRNLTNQKSFYTTISRARHQAVLVIDSREMLEKRLETTTGEKTSALDVLDVNERCNIQKNGNITAEFFSQFEPSIKKEKIQNRNDQMLGL